MGTAHPSKLKNFSLDDYIRKNFRKTVPNEQMWRKGAFSSLTLKPHFYGSATASRIFKKIYGLKTCKVVMEPLTDQEPIRRNDPKEVTSCSTSDDSDLEVVGRSI